MLIYCAVLHPARLTGQGGVACRVPWHATPEAAAAQIEADRKEDGNTYPQAGVVIYDIPPGAEGLCEWLNKMGA